MKDKWESFMLDESQHTYTKQGNMRAPSYVQMGKWIKETWDGITPDSIRRGFQRILEPSASDVEYEHEHDDFLHETSRKDLSKIPADVAEMIDDGFTTVTGDNFDGFADE